MTAPIASGAGFLPATGGRSFSATSPGDAQVRAAAGTLSATLRSAEYGLESQEGRRLRHRRPLVKSSRPGRAGQARANIVQAAGKVKDAFKGLTGGLRKEPVASFRFAVPPGFRQ
jgi:hypothetical protein